MSPEDIARRFEEIPGHDLIDYAEVGLPIFRLLLDAVTMIRRPLGPIAEFSLRAVDAGMSTPETAGAFLGLDASIVRGSLDTLVGDGLVERPLVKDAQPSSAYGVTEAGREALRDVAQYRPQDQILTVDYDGLLGKPVWLEDEALSSSHHLALRNAIEIHPYPAEPPTAPNLDIAEVKATVAKQFRTREDPSFDVLALKRVARVIRLFRPAVGLAFRMRATKDIRIVFVVEGTRHEDLERAFSEKNGPRKMRIVQSVDETDMQAKIRRRLGREIVDRLPKDEEIRALRRVYAVARLREDISQKKVERAVDLSERAKAQDLARSAAEEAESAATALRHLPARQMAVYEQREFLQQALVRARNILWVSSTSVRDSALSTNAFRRLEALLGRGVKVKLFLTSSPEQWGKAKHEARAFEQLRTLTKRYGGFSLVHRPKDDGLHYLVCDDAFAVVTNQPFLSNMAKVRNFVHVHGFVLQGPELVQPLYNRLESPAGSSQ